MGPTCEVVLQANVKPEQLDQISEFLRTTVENLHETRKGRHWKGWIESRPVIISVRDVRDEEPAAVEFAAGCNDREDYEMLRKLSHEIAALIGGKPTEPIK